VQTRQTEHRVQSFVVTDYLLRRRPSRAMPPMASNPNDVGSGTALANEAPTAPPDPSMGISSPPPDSRKLLKRWIQRRVEVNVHPVCRDIMQLFQAACQIQLSNIKPCTRITIFIAECERLACIKRE